MISDIVVMVPGLIGSVLSKDGKDIWNYSGGAAWSLKFGGALKALELSAPDDDALDDLGDGIIARAPMADISVVPGLYKLGGYSDMKRMLLSRGTLVEGQNYFEFPYDWRRSNRVAGRKLAKNAHQWLASWRTKSGNADARIVFIAHSMGGLVSRYFIECLEGWKVTRSLITIGTPFRGSGNAVSYLSNGYRFCPAGIGVDVSAAMRTFDSIYQLLPAYPFVLPAPDADLARITEVDVPNIDRARALKAAHFYDEVTQAAKANAQLEPYQLSNFAVRPVIGTDQSTTESARLVDGLLEALPSYPGGGHLGDGTVPRVSASPVDLDRRFCTYVPNQHSLLQSDPACVNHLHGVLTETAIDDRRFRQSTNPISLSIPDLQTADRAIEIAAVPSQYVQFLDANVTDLDNPDRVETARLRRDSAAGYYRAEMSLPAGAYRVDVSATGHKTVSDVVLVADLR